MLVKFWKNYLLEVGFVEGYLSKNFGTFTFREKEVSVFGGFETNDVILPYNVILSQKSAQNDVILTIFSKIDNF